MAVLPHITPGIVLVTTFVLLVARLPAGTHAANILVYNAVGSHSIRLSMFPLMEALAERGHNVTFLSAFDNFEDPQKKSNITYVTPKKWKDSMGDWEEHIRFFDVRKAHLSPQMWLDLTKTGALSCEMLYSDPEFVHFVKTSTFDLIIMEGLVNECALGLVHLYQSKLVVYGTSVPFPWFAEAYGFPDESSTLTDVIFDFPVGDGMSFLERVTNALSPIVFSLKREYLYFPALEEITRNGLGLEKGELPSFRDIEKTTSLVLLTTHATLDIPRSLPPNVVYVGGSVVNKKTKPLPNDVEKFLNSASDGFIYVSFGTVAEFTHFDREVQLEFISALGSFPDTKFLWKASVQINDTLPKNVMLAKWVPQQTVLGHPKIKGFVSHCGMGSMTEAVHFGVPLVLLPILADQDFNANVMKSRGVAVKLEITTLKKEELENGISEILNNDRYRLSMKKLSDAFHDRTMTPMENGVWWVEYVLRHDNSNEYLVPLSIQQPWWKRRQIDVWLFLGASLLAGVLIVLVLSLYIIKTIFQVILKEAQQQPKIKLH